MGNTSFEDLSLRQQWNFCRTGGYDSIDELAEWLETGEIPVDTKADELTQEDLLDTIHDALVAADRYIAYLESANEGDEIAKLETQKKIDGWFGIE